MVGTAGGGARSEPRRAGRRAVRAPARGRQTSSAEDLCLLRGELLVGEDSLLVELGELLELLHRILGRRRRDRLVVLLLAAAAALVLVHRHLATARATRRAARHAPHRSEHRHVSNSLLRRPPMLLR